MLNISVSATDHPRAAQDESVCFVACVESGPLEAQTARLAESIRRFGGALAGSDVLAITPRFGPPLSRTTRRAFARLGVRHQRVSSHPRYAWYHYLNTPLALLAAEDLTAASTLVWVDSDVLIVDEPSALILRPDVDFRACPTDNGVVGSTGSDSPHDPDWRRLCKLMEVDIDELPWVTTHVEQERIRLCFQSGIFAYRRGVGYSQFYLDMIVKALDARFGFARNAEHFTDSVCLGLSAHKFGLRWEELPYSHNFTMGSFLASPYSSEDCRRASILHYHDAMDPYHWPAFLEGLSSEHPSVYGWLRDEQPLTDPAPPAWRVVREGLRVTRGVSRKRYRLRMLPAQPA